MTQEQIEHEPASPVMRGSCLGVTIFCFICWAVLIGYMARACA